MESKGQKNTHHRRISSKFQGRGSLIRNLYKLITGHNNSLKKKKKKKYFRREIVLKTAKNRRVVNLFKIL